jgi:hypothetical protein
VNDLTVAKGFATTGSFHEQVTVSDSIEYETAPNDYCRRIFYGKPIHGSP